MAIAIETSGTISTRSCSTSMRALVRWSLSSLRNTTPSPCQGEPSRRMTLSVVLEVAGVDRLQAGLLHRQPGEPAAGGHHRGRRLRAHVAFGEQPQPAAAHLFDGAHAWNLAQPVREPLALRLDLDRKAAAQDLAPEFLDGADQHD